MGISANPNRPRPTRTTVKVIHHPVQFSTAPNGSSRNVADYFTTEVQCEIWPEYEEPEISSTGLSPEPTGRMRKGTYSGRVYRSDVRYISPTPVEGSRYYGQCLGGGSAPWTDADTKEFAQELIALGLKVACDNCHGTGTRYDITCADNVSTHASAVSPCRICNGTGVTDKREPVARAYEPTAPLPPELAWMEGF
jgi:hypothetical protein